MVFPHFLSLHRTNVCACCTLKAQREASINRYNRAGDVAGVVTGEEPDNASNLVGLSDSAHGIEASHRSLCRSELGRHVGVHQARGPPR